MQDELATMQVFGESKVGWCENTPTNESMDEDGNPVFSTTGFNGGDPTAPKRRAYDDPEVCRLREHLRANNGLRGLEIVQPHEVERAARIFFRDGFVVVRDLLDPAQLARFREGSARVLRSGNRPAPREVAHRAHVARAFGALHASEAETEGTAVLRSHRVLRGGRCDPHTTTWITMARWAGSGARNWPKARRAASEAD